MSARAARDGVRGAARAALLGCLRSSCWGARAFGGLCIRSHGRTEAGWGRGLRVPGVDAEQHAVLQVHLLDPSHREPRFVVCLCGARGANPLLSAAP